MLSPRKAKQYRLTWNWTLLQAFFGSRHCTCAYILGGLRTRGGNISVDLPLFVLLYNTNFMNKLKFNKFLKYYKRKIINCLYTFSLIFKTTPTFHSEERLVNLVRGRECFAGLSILLVYGSSEYTNLGQVSLSSLLPCMAAVLLRVGRWGRSATLSSLNNNVHGPKLTESKNISSLVFVKIYFVWPLKPKSVGICSYLFWLLKYGICSIFGILTVYVYVKNKHCQFYSA